MINNVTTRLGETERILENYHNNFGIIATEIEEINRSIATLQSEINQRHALIQSMNRRGSDQPSEASSSSVHSSSPNSSTERNLTFDEMSYGVAMRIRELGGNIKQATIKIFNNNSTRCSSSTLNDIGKWLDDME
ncbi:8699_t:CDS:2 [Ambispora gerdemannii]|uniref:8699_t:CDS:1 n=1 Tax=Ambispora gerdemannii TaxID=144530 RepID=A0A9N9CZN5_9GLOM|nr:8699_t:CDS:2 [Ambispora gerdemannii]